MRVLGIDTSGLQLCVCLWQGDAVLARRTYDGRREQGEVLLPLVDECLAQAGAELKAIEAIAVVTGPGSFTGLRLGLAAAQGLARVLNCHTAGYDRFSLLRAALAGRDAAIVLDSLRAELFVQFSGQAPQMLTAEQIKARWSGAVTGDGAAFFSDHTVVQVPAAAELAARQLVVDLSAHATLPPLLPYYLRAPDVTGVAV